MSKYDVDKIKSLNTLSNIVRNYTEIQPNGAEFKGCCPFHNEKTASFTVKDEPGFYYCFGCGANGDVVDFVADMHSCSFREACEILGGEKDLPDIAPRNIEKEVIPGIYDGYEKMPLPNKLPQVGKEFSVFNPKRSRWTTYTPSMIFIYNRFLVLRIEMQGGKKITPVIGFCQTPTQDSPIWTHVPAGEDRPLYKYTQDFTQALLVEGEKAADAARRMVGDKLDVITWCGGGKAWKKTDWGPLKSRSVILWPDDDPQGIKTMKEIGTHLKKIGCSVKTIQVQGDKDGWDAADAETEKWDGKKVIAWAKANIAKPAQPIEKKDIKAPKKLLELPEDKSETKFDDRPFRILGFNSGAYYYLPKGTQQISQLTLAQHSQSYFLGLAPLSHWSQNFAGAKDKIDWSMVADALLRASERSGIFDGHTMLRGRGAWKDGKRTIMHMGPVAYVDGKPMHPVDIDSKYIYQAMPDMGAQLGDALSNKEAYKLFELSSRLSWQNKLSSALLAGWCVIAPLSGILNWRPHIWVTGPSGSGKTTVMNDIIGSTTGKTGIRMDGTATEAGIRQTLYQDARPIIFDEAEAEEKRDSERIQKVLDLARISSSGGRVLKGSKDGKAQSFSVRSCFCFSSINTSVKHFADESRISKLILVKDLQENSDDYYSTLENEISNTFTEEYAAGLLSRSLSNIDTLQANINSFTKAATKVFKSRRIADQVGTMLAGTYLCHSTNTITPEQAEEWLSKQADWSDHTTINEKTDPQRLLDKICTHNLIVATRSGTIRPSIGDLILQASGNSDQRESYTEELAQKELKKIGIIAEFDHFTISNASDPIKKILQDTPWHSDWGRPLKELPDAEATNTTFFAPGIKARATKLPIDLVKE